MRIADVSAHALSSPIDPPQKRAFHGGKRTLHKRDFVLVVIETPDGERGYGPAGASSSAMREFFEGASQRAFAEAVTAVGADLAGTELAEPTDIHGEVTDHGRSALLASQVGSALEVALFDLAGKRRGAPVHELLTDREPTTTLDLYASAGMYMEPAGYAAQADTLANCGFHGYKYRPGIGPEGDCRTAELLHETVEGGMDLMADAHTWWKLDDQAYTATERRAVVDAYEKADVFWLEEPVAPDDYEGYLELAESTTVPLAGGESEASPGGLRALADTGAVQFIQGDVRHHRGYSGCLSVAEACHERGVQFVPHHFGTWLGLVANAHLVAAAPGTRLLEYPVFEDDPALDATPDPGMYPCELAFDVLETSLDVSDGQFSVPDDPGLGVDVNTDVPDRYPFVDGPWTTFEYA